MIIDILVILLAIIGLYKLGDWILDKMFQHMLITILNESLRKFMDDHPGKKPTDKQFRHYFRKEFKSNGELTPEIEEFINSLSIQEILESEIKA